MDDKNTQPTEETTTHEETTEETVDAGAEAGSQETEEEKSTEYWKKRAQDEEDARKKAEKALAKNRFKSKKKQDDEPSDDNDGDDGDKPLTESELRKILAEDRENTRREVLSTRISEIASNMTDTQEEADAVVAIYSNRSFPQDMSLEQQLREAYFIAHGERLFAKNGELKRSLKNKKNVNASGSENAHKDAPKAGEPTLSPQDKAEMSRLGFTWDGKEYTKKLGNGKTLVKDVKLKRTYLR